ncbi:hypothetical protein BLNAU_21105 [Blattamonas nauphoetae]|uniref:Uncharacterized protein n=1 Tax=Blattamonas nauphoetae TaxID=2049346 RepID=A0ABQ9WXV3_9EUKA|nr:hypothetical protein BLNAU_21105 [Blattamonas nauphoetae]
MVHSALSEEIETESLASYLERLERSDKRVPWTQLLEWFVEAVIGAEIIRNEHLSAPPLTNENIRIDISSTIVITSPSSPLQPSNACSLSSDIATICQFFLHIHRTLEQQNRLILPLDPEQEDIVFAHIMVALVEHFVASGDLILPNSSPTDHFLYFSECYRKLNRMYNLNSNPFVPDNLATSFAQFVLRPNNHNSFVPAEHSFLRRNTIESSERLRDAVRKVDETHSMEIVQTAYFDWREWQMMTVMVEKGDTSLTDHSFLQSRCLRSTLLSLQTKHQLRAYRNQIEENNFADSCQLQTTGDIPLISSAITTQTALPSSQSPSTSQHLSSEQCLFQTDPVVRHSRQVLLAIHYLLTRPPPKSFPWNIRPSFESDSEHDDLGQTFDLFVDLNEKFDTSLFCDTDDAQLVAALRRCRAVIEETKLTKCISDVSSFRSLLMTGFRSSNSAVQFECHNLFFEISDCLQKVDDPHEGRFVGLQSAFRDGELWEKMALLRLWGRWLNFKAKKGFRRFVKESEFDFSGFLASDMRDIRLFFRACQFVGSAIFNEAMSMSLRWQLDFVHQFEKKNQILLRVSRDPRLFVKQNPSRLYMTPLATMLGSYLSILRGCDYPSALTELIATDLDTSQLRLSLLVNPALFLNHTSIAPKHRHSFFPMDLMFERYLRSDPDVFLKAWSDVSECTPRKFLFTPYVGLHQLLLRCPTLNLDQESLENLVYMLFIKMSRQESTQKDVYNLFSLYPPPRLIDTPLTSPRLVRDNRITWIEFLNLLAGFGVYTAPFGACSSLAKVFKMLSPFDLNENTIELKLLWMVGDVVVSLHWLSIPDSMSLPLSPVGRSILEFITGNLLCRFPALVSAAFEFFHRFVSVASDIVRMDLVRNDPSSNDHFLNGATNVPSNELSTFFSQTVQAYRSGTEKEKVSILLGVRNKIEEEDERPASLAPLSHPRLPLSSFISSRRFCCVVFLQHADPTLSVPATHAVGLVCDSSLSCGDVEGVLSGGVVEKVCSWVEGWKEDGKEVGRVLGLLRVVDKLCVGLKGALRSAQKQEQEQKENSGKEQGQAGQNEEESRDGWSFGSRCQSALDLMENTLLGLCSGRESEEKESSAEVEVLTQVGGMLIRHFPHVVSGGRKEVGVIGVDVGREMRAMEEREKRREEEMRKKFEEVELLKEKVKREAERETEERRNEHELKMAELSEQAERHKRFIEEGEEREREASRRREEEERRIVGSAAIEWFPADGYSLNGSVFTRSGGSRDPTLLSAEFGNVVVRFTFTFQTISSYNTIGIVASALTAKAKVGSLFTSLVGGAGWCMKSTCRFAIQHGKEIQRGSACAGGREGQRVVLEADGRDGKRTLRLSQDGKTQPTFFSRIPVPFRFAIVLRGTGDAVSIESVEVVAEPQLSGGGTEIPMDDT